MADQSQLTKEQIQKIEQVFFPNILERQNAVKTSGKRFVHYTSAQAAMSILKERKIWMRQPTCMNDFTEVEHGVQCLQKAYWHPSQTFKRSLDALFDGLSGEVEQTFDHLLNKTRHELYLACFSEHEDTEDQHGRLSMWRAYGRGNGVGIVFNQGPFFSETDVFKSYVLPISYLEPDALRLNLDKIAKNIDESAAVLKSWGKSLVRDAVLNMLRFVVLSTKHCGFFEEREWRVIYSPSIEASTYLTHAIETIEGVPQEIYKFPIENLPDQGITNLDLNNLVERIIIGPTEYSFALYKAFVKILTDARVENAPSKVIISSVPLRH